MLDGPSVASALVGCGVTHVVWIPDSELGLWEPALLGGKRPVAVIQCTGFFEAGDAFRNLVHEMKVPLFLVVGVRSWYALRQGGTGDTCPVFTEPVLKAWQVPYVLFDRRHTGADLAAAYRQAQAERRAHVVLLAE